MPKEPKGPDENDGSVVEIPQEPKELEVIVINNEDEEAPAALVEPHRAPVDGGANHNYLHPFSTWSKLEDRKLGNAMPERICINLDEWDKEQLNNPARGVKLITVLLSSGCMSQYQKDYYMREVDVWGHAYRHCEDRCLLVIYQGKCPMDWEWEQAQTTIWQL